MKWRQFEKESSSFNSSSFSSLFSSSISSWKRYFVEVVVEVGH